MSGTWGQAGANLSVPPACLCWEAPAARGRARGCCLPGQGRLAAAPSLFSTEIKSLAAPSLERPCSRALQTGIQDDTMILGMPWVGSGSC